MTNVIDNKLKKKQVGNILNGEKFKRLAMLPMYIVGVGGRDFIDITHMCTHMHTLDTIYSHEPGISFMLILFPEF